MTIILSFNEFINEAKGDTTKAAAGMAGGALATRAVVKGLSKKASKMSGKAGIRARGAMRARRKLSNLEFKKLFQMAKKAPKASLAGIGLSVGLATLVWNFGEAAASSLIGKFQKIENKIAQLEEKIAEEQDPDTKEKLQQKLEKLKARRDQAAKKVEDKVEKAKSKNDQLKGKDKTLAKLKAKIAAGNIAKKIKKD